MQRRCASASFSLQLVRLLPGLLYATAIASQKLDKNNAAAFGDDSTDPVWSNGTTLLNRLWSSAVDFDAGGNLQYAGLSAVDNRQVNGDSHDEKDERVVDCPPTSSPPISVRRITGFQVDVGQQSTKLREIQVRHNIKVSTI